MLDKKASIELKKFVLNVVCMYEDYISFDECKKFAKMYMREYGNSEDVDKVFSEDTIAYCFVLLLDR
jgi:hypothetical protein